MTKVYWKGSHSSIHICRQHTFAQSFLDSKHYLLYSMTVVASSTHNDTIITQQKGLQCIWAAFRFGCILCCMFNNAISLNVCRYYVLALSTSRPSPTAPRDVLLCLVQETDCYFIRSQRDARSAGSMHRVLDRDLV